MWRVEGYRIVEDVTVFEDGEEEPTEEEQKKRHALLLFAFAFARNEALDRIGQLTDALSEGAIDTRKWAEEFRRELTARHAEAWSIGRRMAGDMAPMSETDIREGLQVWARQETFFRGFIDDIEAGRYSEGDELKERAFGARAKQYVEAIRGTASEAFRVEMGDEPIFWRMGAAEHCKPSPGFDFNCPDLSREPAKPASEWATAPGFGDTPCRNHCYCYFESEDGKYSTIGLVSRGITIEDPGDSYSELPKRAQSAVSQNEKKLRADKNDETLLAFDDTGRIVYRAKGTGPSVYVPQEDWPKIKDKIVTHNHPRGWGFPAADPRSAGNSFSLSDIELASHAEVAEMRAISRKFRHSVKPGPDGWNADYFESVIKPAYERISEEVKAQFREDVSRSKMSGKSAEARFYHEVMERLSQEIGLVYRRTT